MNLKKVSIKRIIELLGAEWVAASSSGEELDLEKEYILNLAPLASANSDSLCFFTNAKLKKDFLSTSAKAVMVRKKIDHDVHQIIHPNPYWAYAKVAQIFYPHPENIEKIHPRAIISSEAEIAKERVQIDANVVVEAGAKIAAGVRLYSGVYVGENAVIGENSRVYPNSVIYSETIVGKSCVIHAGAVLGADGFGYAPYPPSANMPNGEILRIPQVGRVRLEDEVEIGAGSTIDRAALEETLIGFQTKIDSHVHIGHNCKIGHHCFISGMTGIAGSTTIGNWVTLGGGVGVNGHITVADGVIAGGKTGIARSIREPGSVVMGYPAQPLSSWKKQIMIERKLPEMYKAFKDQTKKKPS